MTRRARLLLLLAALLPLVLLLLPLHAQEAAPVPESAEVVPLSEEQLSADNSISFPVDI